MQLAATIQTLCSCTGADHELRCVLLWVVEERGRLYEGLYDGRRAANSRPERVKLLNPRYWSDADDDAAMRRFSLLEID